MQLGDITLGQQQFQFQCTACHQANGQGRGPALTGPDSPIADMTDEQLYDLVRNGTGHTDQQPVSTVRLSDRQLASIILYILDPLVGREPPAAGRAVAPAADGLAGVGGAGIHHPVIVDTTPRTPHRQEPQELWRRNASPGTKSPSTGGHDERAADRERTGLDVVGRREQARHDPRVLTRTNTLRDRPEGVTGTDHDDLLRGGRRRFPPPDRARRQRAQEHSDQGCRHDGHRPTPTNVRSLHPLRMGERLSGVKRLGRTYVSTPPEPVLTCGP